MPPNKMCKMDGEVKNDALEKLSSRQAGVGCVVELTSAVEFCFNTMSKIGWPGDVRPFFALREHF